MVKNIFAAIKKKVLLLDNENKKVMLMSGFVGEFYFYRLENGETLVVDPDPDIKANFKLFQKERPEYNKDTFRGLKAVVLKEEDELVPVRLKNSEEYFEGLYFLVKKNSQTI